MAQISFILFMIILFIISHRNFASRSSTERAFTQKRQESKTSSPTTSTTPTPTTTIILTPSLATILSTTAISRSSLPSTSPPTLAATSTSTLTTFSATATTTTDSLTTSLSTTNSTTTLALSTSPVTFVSTTTTIPIPTFTDDMMDSEYEYVETEVELEEESEEGNSKEESKEQSQEEYDENYAVGYEEGTSSANNPSTVTTTTTTATMPDPSPDDVNKRSEKAVKTSTEQFIVVPKDPILANVCDDDRSQRMSHFLSLGQEIHTRYGHNKTIITHFFKRSVEVAVVIEGQNEDNFDYETEIFHKIPYKKIVFQNMELFEDTNNFLKIWRPGSNKTEVLYLKKEIEYHFGGKRWKGEIKKILARVAFLLIANSDHGHHFIGVEDVYFNNPQYKLPKKLCK